MTHFEEGRTFEEQMADRLGLEMVPASGATPWAKLDLGEDGQLLLSLKWTSKGTFTINMGLVGEIDDAVSAPGGVGGDVIGGLLYYLNGKIRIDMDAVDLMKMLQEKRRFGMQSKAEAKRERARTPILQREDDES